MVVSRLACSLLLMSAACYAHADSSVTLYGLLDASITYGHQSSARAAPGGAKNIDGHSKTRMESGVGPGSRFGFKGSESLGDGLKAVFVLEGGFGVNTGQLQQGGLLFGRQAFVGLEGSSWSLTAGRQYAPMDPALAMTDALGGAYWGNILVNTGHIINGSYTAKPGDGAFHTPSRVDNSVLATVKHGGFRGSFMVGLGNQDLRNTGRLWSLGLSYTEKPFALHGVFTRFRQNEKAILPNAKPEWLTEYMVGGSYDFEVVKLFAGYYGLHAAKNLNNLSPAALSAPFGFTWRKMNTAWFGVQVPTGSGRISAQVARSVYRYQSGPKGRTIIFGAAYEHFLSKRTALYASLGQVDNNSYASAYLGGAVSMVPSNGYGSTSRAISLGMKHSF